MYKFTNRLIQETFLQEIKDESLRFWFKQSILDGRTHRDNLRMTQKEFAEHQGMSLMTVKNIERGTCRNSKLVEMYKEGYII